MRSCSHNIDLATRDFTYWKNFPQKICMMCFKDLYEGTKSVVELTSET